MKKLVLSLAAVAVLTAAVPSRAMDITAGANTWYSWWDFKSEHSENDTKFDPALLYGPALSFKFTDDYNLTFVFLYGKFDMTESGTTREISRSDSDLILNYRLNGYFKIFAGGKYMAYEMPDFKHRGLGPGAGISAVFPVVNSFYILGNISGLYLWGKHEQEDQTEGTRKDDYNEYGMNSSLSLAYYIEPASVTLSLGGRYQYFKTDFEASPYQKDLTHHFYGITASATYSFSI